MPHSQRPATRRSFGFRHVFALLAGAAVAGSHFSTATLAEGISHDTPSFDHDTGSAEHLAPAQTHLSDSLMTDEDDELGFASSPQQELPQWDFDSAKMREAFMPSPSDPLMQHIVYVADEHAADWERHPGGKLHKRSEEDEPGPNRVVRRAAGCPSGTTFKVLPKDIQEGNPFSLSIANIPAVGVDFGDGSPNWFGFWNASFVEINNGQTTTLTTVSDVPLATTGVGFSGCFPTVNAADLIATLTLSGSLTPSVTSKYFVQMTASPGLASTQVPVRVTSTPYKFTPGPEYTPPTGIVSATPTPRKCPEFPGMIGPDGNSPAVINPIVPGTKPTVTLQYVPESIVGSDTVASKTTFQAVYTAGEIVTLAYSKTVKGAQTFDDTNKPPMTKTLVLGKKITYRRTITSTINPAVDGCLAQLKDANSWAIPAANKLDKDALVLYLQANVAGNSLRAIGMLPEASTKVTAPYNGPKPTKIPATKTLCGEMYVQVYPPKATPGANITVQINNIPATPISLLAKGYSTVYTARYAATLLSNGLPVQTLPSTRFTTTVGGVKPTCISVTRYMKATASPKFYPLTAAPPPSRLYSFEASADDFGTQANVGPIGQVEANVDINLIKDNTVPDSVMLPGYPCLVGPYKTETTITWNKKAPNAQFYSLQKTNTNADEAQGDVQVQGRTLSPSTMTVLSIQLDNLYRKISFIVRDRESNLYLDLYNQDFATIPSPVDWKVRWDRVGGDLGLMTSRVMPPFNVTIEFQAPYTRQPRELDGTTTSKRSGVSSKPDIKIRHTVTIQPWWRSSNGRSAQPMIYFNVTSANMGGMDQFTMTCDNPNAKREAFRATSVGRLTKVVDQRAAVQKTQWAFSVGSLGSQKITDVPLVIPSRQGPLSELNERWASNVPGRGRTSPNMPTTEQLQKDIASWRQVE